MSRTSCATYYNMPDVTNILSHIPIDAVGDPAVCVTRVHLPALQGFCLHANVVKTVELLSHAKHPARTYA